MKYKKICLFALCGLLFTGCTKENSSPKEELPAEQNSETMTLKQTSTLGVPIEKLVSGNYYVLHEGLYYPLVVPTYTNYNYTDDAPGTSVDDTRMALFHNSVEDNIPTFYPGDKLIFYSDVNLLDYMVWERYEDLKYSMGMYGIQTMTNGRCYLNMSSNNDCFLGESELYELYDIGEVNILLDKIGGQQVDKNWMQYGMIINYLEKMQSYDMELYVGTNYKHFIGTADTHVYHAMELFASVNYETIQATIYEIEVPEYLVTGIYSLNSRGFLRICREDSYSDETDYNVPLLEHIDPITGDPVNPSQYSEYPVLNYYSTSTEGALGYMAEMTVDPNQGENTPLQDLLSEIQSAVIKEKTISFQGGEDCTIVIRSNERTGDIYLVVDDTRYNFSRKDDGITYTLGVKFKKDTEGALVISGLLHNYAIDYSNCKEIIQPESTKEPVTDAPVGNPVEENLSDEPSETEETTSEIENSDMEEE